MTAEAFPRFDLEGRVALVTGAARGIGRAIALALAHAGADVALGLRDIATGAELARTIEGMGRRALPLQMDVARLPEIAGAVSRAVAELGRIDILVNNAGLAPENPAECTVGQSMDVAGVVVFLASPAASGNPGAESFSDVVKRPRRRVNGPRIHRPPSEMARSLRSLVSSGASPHES
jgi:hypothetical protein